MQEKERSADKVLSILKEHPQTWRDIISTSDPTQALRELQKVADKAKKETPPPAYYSDKWIYRMIVGALGALAWMAAVGGIILVSGGKTAPDILVALGSAAVGALAGLLAPSPIGK